MILYLVTKLSSKNLKKFLLNLIETLDLTYFIIKSTAMEVSEQITQQLCFIKQCTYLFNLVSLMETYNCDRLMPVLFPVCYQIFAGFVYHLL